MWISAGRNENFRIREQTLISLASNRGSRDVPRREREQSAVSHADGSDDVAADPSPREDRLVG